MYTAQVDVCKSESLPTKYMRLIMLTLSQICSKPIYLYNLFTLQVTILFIDYAENADLVM